MVVYLLFPVNELHQLDYHKSGVDGHRFLFINPPTDTHELSHIVAGCLILRIKLKTLQKEIICCEPVILLHAHHRN